MIKKFTYKYKLYEIHKCALFISMCMMDIWEALLTSTFYFSGVESLGGEGQRNPRLWGRRVPKLSVCGSRSCLSTCYPSTWHSVWSQSDLAGHVDCKSGRYLQESSFWKEILSICRVNWSNENLVGAGGY